MTGSTASRWRDRAIAALLMATVAACGGDTAPSETAPTDTAPTDTAPTETAASETEASEGATAPAPPSSAQAPGDAQDFVARADERCARTFVELDGVEYPTDDSLASIVAPFRQVASINREQLEDLRALAPPAGDEEVIGNLLDTASVGVDAIDELVEAAGVEDVDAYDQALTSIEQSAQQTFDQARAYGFATCFIPPGG